ncbi:hypothetical protein [Nitrolancea hollandica]|uniref:HEPN AbiU2-like domain-containing protein n=1 Tax=Nitrolancea hollandica Lb TaxID=1129897 RepID=I4EHS4_9BACT|nr:hypothetical protein [Nitrolancea hollandica]CCF84236.1 hypothetical protein NITHO_3260002 [Nitrolancea hollandica Lb]
MAKRKIKSQYDDWLERIVDISNHAAGLLRRREIFREYQDMINVNAKIHRPPDFHNWVKMNYADSIVMSIRRELDYGPTTGSLRRLLEEIRDNYELITRQAYINRWVEDAPDETAIADACFTELAGNGSTFDPRIAIADIKVLDALGSDIKKYVNKNIAHREKINKPIKLTYEKLHKFIDDYEAVVIKYHSLLTGDGYSTLLPVSINNWKIIFHESRIEK